MNSLSLFLEMCFLLCFAAAWPANILKSWRSRSARGKSVAFAVVVEVGYIFGILSKFASGTITYVLFFYFLNFAMVAVDLVLTLRNKRLDAKADAEFIAIAKEL